MPAPRTRMGSRFAKRLLYALGASALCAVSARAQQYNFTRYNDGLPQAQILALHQDNRGFLWVGTYGGVARFDGSSFRSYSRQNGLISNTITAITQDAEGRIVVGVDGGVCTLNESLFQCHEWKRDIGGDRSFDVLAEVDGTIWVATSAGLVRLDKRGKMHVYK